MFALFSKAFAGLYYSPTLFWSSILSRLTYLHSGFNLSQEALCQRGMFSAYRDVLLCYRNFGPIIPIPSKLKTVPDGWDSFFDLMTTDFFVFPSSEDIPTDGKKSDNFFHYDPSKLDKGEHLSSNIPTFFALIGLAIISYEINEYYVENDHLPLINLKLDNYILLSNACLVRKLFVLSEVAKDVPKVMIGGDENKSFESEFRSLKKKHWFHDPKEMCFLENMQTKFCFVKVRHMRDRIKGSDWYHQQKFMTISELAVTVFSQSVDFQSNKFFRLDKSFLRIVKHLLSPTNLRELMRIPFTSLQPFVHRTKKGSLPQETIKIFQQIFGEDSTEEPEDVDRAVIERPLAIRFGPAEKKLFRAAFNKLGGTTTQDVSKENIQKTVRAMHDQAAVHAEKLLECLVIANTGASLMVPLSENIQFLVNNFGNTPILGNSAARLVNRIRTCFEDQACQDAFRKDFSSLPPLIDQAEATTADQEKEANQKRSKLKVKEDKINFTLCLQKAAFTSESNFTSKFQELMNLNSVDSPSESWMNILDTTQFEKIEPIDVEGEEEHNKKRKSTPKSDGSVGKEQDSNKKRISNSKRKKLADTAKDKKYEYCGSVKRKARRGAKVNDLVLPLGNTPVGNDDELGADNNESNDSNDSTLENDKNGDNDGSWDKVAANNPDVGNDEVVLNDMHEDEQEDDDGSWDKVAANNPDVGNDEVVLNDMDEDEQEDDNEDEDEQEDDDEDEDEQEDDDEDEDEDKDKNRELVEIQQDETMATLVENKESYKIARCSKQELIEVPQKSNQKLIDAAKREIVSLMEKAPEVILLSFRLNIEVRLDYTINSPMKDKLYFKEINQLIELRDTYNAATEDGNYRLDVLTFGKKVNAGNVQRRTVLKMFNRPKYPNDPLIELDNNGKQIGKFEYIFLEDIDSDDQEIDFIELNKQCKKKVQEHNESQGEYVWECSKVLRDFQYKNQWFHVKSTSKFVHMATPEQKELSGMNNNFIPAFESLDIDDIEKIPV
jgi:hypothetical protein